MPKIITIRRRKPAEGSNSNSKSRRMLSTGGNILFWIAGICFAAVVLSILARMVTQFATPGPVPLLTLEQDIPMPGALPDKYRTPQNQFAPGLALLYDHFDFQAFDPQTGLLFIAH